MSAEDDWLVLADGDGSWQVDASFLASNWTCIWDRGCQGIERTADPEAGLGCCSVGAELLDEEEAMTIAALAATIDPNAFQHYVEFVGHGAFSDTPTPAGKRNTRVVDGACIFLNRPGFEGGHGCVLHAEAQRLGESHIDWKPSICWQLPLRVQRSSEEATVRGWLRQDWGDEGDAMAWCCTEGEQAYVGERPVVESLREELVALLGEDLVDEIAQRLASRD